MQASNGGAGSGDARIGNDISGTVHGPSVQAGVVHGDIHITAAAPAAPPEPHVPWQLPPAVPLTNRSAEFTALEQALAGADRRGGPTLIVLNGLGGVGKTVLALSWLHSVRDRCTDGQLYTDLGAEGPDGPVAPGRPWGGSCGHWASRRSASPGPWTNARRPKGR